MLLRPQRHTELTELACPDSSHTLRDGHRGEQADCHHPQEECGPDRFRDQAGQQAALGNRGAAEQE